MSANADLFAVSDAALEPAGTIRFANKLACLRVVSSLVVSLRTRQTAAFRPRADRDRFYCGYRHHCLCEESVQLQIPRRMRAETGNNPTRSDLEDSAERIALLSCFVDQLDHLLLCGFVGTVQRRVVGNCSELIPTQLEWRLRNAAELDHVTANFDSKDCE